MKRFLFFTSAILAIASSLSAKSEKNVLFILADDLGWSDTTLYGQTKLYQTPNLERLAARGMKFTRAYTASPLCSPTRSSILTGLHPARTGLTTPNCHTPTVTLQASVAAKAAPNKKRLEVTPVTRLDLKYRTLSKTLQQAGYTTAHFGKWHLGPEPYSPFEHGFDIDIPHWPGPGPAGSFVAPWKFKNFKEKYPKEHIEDRMGDEAVAFMESQGEKPFFLNYWQFSVHAPFDAKAELIEKYRGLIDPKDEQRSPTYAAMVQSLDDNVGKMLDALDRLGIADDTIIIFFSDNGGNMYNEVDGTTPTANRPLRGGKGNNYDGGTRVPAVVVWPGEIEPGSKSDELITSTDFYPTLLEMLGITPAEGQRFDGMSIVPAFRGESLERDGIFSYFPHSTGVPDTLPPSVAMHLDDWKLLRLFHEGENGAHDYRLYQVSDDIGETNNLAAEFPDRVAAMDAKIEAFLKDCHAVVPLANPAYDSRASELNATGWSATKDTTLTQAGGVLAVHSTGNDPHFQARLAKPIPAGKITMRVRVKSDPAGPLEIRWEEQGIKPAFHRDRLVRSKPIAASEWQDVVISFVAKKPVVSFRVDLAPGDRDTEFERWVIEADGVEVKEWDFAKPSKH
ncbi:MAG: sulfatase [Verrucomicrobiae bacterium]|nr:sulfatase [Verrucomicrobiae bacterium]